MIEATRAFSPESVSGSGRHQPARVAQSYARDAALFFLLGALATLALQATTGRIMNGSSSSGRRAATGARIPSKCTQMSSDGHCDDADNGGAWSYRHPDGTCADEEAKLIMASPAARALPDIFPDARDVLDFGGGVGAYLASYRDKAAANAAAVQKAGGKKKKKKGKGKENEEAGKLVIVEPHTLGKCLFPGLTQSQVSDWPNTPLDQLPHREYDVVQTIEALEHIPVAYHPHLIDALTQATRKYLLFSAAHPGQDGEGHVGPSMKTREQWISEIESKGELVVDEDKTREFHEAAGGGILVENGIVFRRRDSKGRAKGTRGEKQKERAENVKGR